jgi:hypothetical protein
LPNADIYFHSGIVQYRLGDYRASQRSFSDCLKANCDRFDAERYVSIVQTAIEQEKTLFKVNAIYSYVLSGVCLLILSFLWIQYFNGQTRTIQVAVPSTASNAGDTTPKFEQQQEYTVDKSLLTVMTPILLGLLVVAALLPNLNKLKLPGGFEAEISGPKADESNISVGPRGEVGFGSSLPLLSPEPR